MKERFELASHLTYIVECIETNLTGAVKFELTQFLPALDASTLDDKETISEKVHEAAKFFREGNYERAAVCTVSANRLLNEGLRWPDSYSGAGNDAA